MKKTFKILGNVFSWVFNIAMVALLIFACFSVYQSKVNNVEATLFGYKPVFILTGSMEPEMRTHSIAITKNLDEAGIAALEKGDIITYHVWDESSNEVNAEPRKVVITHRIYNIKDIDGEKQYITKGDNNRTSDAYYLTAENIDAEVVWTWNGFADIVAKWQSGWSGKLLILSPIGIIILLYIAVKSFFGGDNNDNNSGNKKSKKNQKEELTEEQTHITEVQGSMLKDPTFYEDN